MSFQVQIAKDAVEYAASEYKENGRASSLLDDKAQKIAAVAGLFLAAGFAYLKPDVVDWLLKASPFHLAWGLISIITMFVICLGFCLGVMWARRSPQPIAIEVLECMNANLFALPESELTDDVQRRYYLDQLRIWKPIILSQLSRNRTKGRFLVCAQLALGIGMISVAIVLVLVVAVVR